MLNLQFVKRIFKKQEKHGITCSGNPINLLIKWLHLCIIKNN